MCDLIGWRDDLEKLVQEGRAKLQKTQASFLEMKRKLQSESGNSSSEVVAQP